MGPNDPIRQEKQAPDWLHQKVHEGELFTASYKTPDGAPVADNASLDILIRTGTAAPHIEFTVSCAQAYEAILYESTTVTDNGTQLSERNRNRRSNKTSVVDAFHTPTVTATGNLILHELASGILGGVSRSEEEWILKPNTNYLLRLTNRAGSAQPMSAKVDWYE